jgi:hypothetical protein
MIDNLKNRMLEHEVTPPAGSWQGIAARLEEEFNQTEIHISQKLSSYEASVPAMLWPIISEKLREDHAPPVTGRVVSFNLRRIAAAVVILTICGSVFYYFNRSADHQNVAKIPSSQQRTEKDPPLPPVEQTMIAAVPKVADRSGFVSRPKRKNRPHSVAVAQQASYQPTMHETDINYADVNIKDNTITKSSISIPTEPIRDEAGNIIMDENLVSSEDINYVTVTGPNGAQTKISKKFLHALSYMNAGSENEDYVGILLQEGPLWRWLFQEWRNKLLNQPSFIPSATNFLDILELKEMLHENF